MNAITRQQPTPLRPQTFAEMERFCAIAARSGMVPTAYANKPEAILIAVQMGTELGLAPMQSLQSIAVIQGRPAVFGDAMPGLVRASGVCAWIEETLTGDGDAAIATCSSLRTGDPKPTVRTFSVGDARKAGLWGKSGPWTQYPARMLAMRARSWCLRDAYPDVLRGLIAAEEAQDIPRDTHRGPTIEATVEAEPPRPAARAESKPAPAEAPVDSTPGPDPEAEKRRGWLSGVLAAVGKCRTVAALQKLDAEIAGTRAWLRDNHPADDAAIADALVSRHEILATPLDDDPFAPMPEIAGTEHAAA